MGLITFIIPVLLVAQSQYDYYDDDAVAGGVDRAFNGIVFIVLIVLAIVAFAFVASGFFKIYYWFNPEADPEYKKKKAIETLKAKGREQKEKRIESSGDNNNILDETYRPINMDCQGNDAIHTCIEHLKHDWEITSVRPEDWENKDIDWGKHINEEHEIWDRGEAAYSKDGRKFLVFENNLTEYKIKEGVEILCDNAFSGFTSEKRIIFPYSLKIIGNFVFWRTHLNKIVIPESVVKITGNPFVACTVIVECKSPHFCYVDNMLFDKSKVMILSVTSDLKVATENIPIKIPSSVKIIGRYSFYEISCGPIVIPNSVLYICDSAFYGTIISDIKLGERIVEIGARAFAWSYIKTMVIPDSVKSLGESAFSHCENLKEIRLSISLTTIEERAFEFCTDLNEVFIPEGIKVIKKEAFSWCKNLRKVHMPNSLEKIENGAFICCGFSEVSLPKHTIVEKGAFMRNCKIIRQE